MSVWAVIAISIATCAFLALVLTLISAAFGILVGSKFDDWRNRRHARRLADRRARGEDRYFDELRSLQTYTPTTVRSPSFAFRRLFWRYFGVLFLTFGIYQIVSKLFDLFPDPFA